MIRPGLILVGLLLLAAPSFATSSVESSTGQPPGSLPIPIANELCDGDCTALPPLPSPFDDAFDFEYGARVSRGGADVKVVTDGNVFLVGPIRAEERIHLLAGSDITVLGNSTLLADEIILQTNPGGGEGGIVIDVPNLPPLGLPPGTRPGSSICGCIRTVGDDGEILVDVVTTEVRSAGGGIRIEGDRLVAASIAADPEAPGGINQGGQDDQEVMFQLFWSITRNGDVYLDVSNTELSALKIEAAGSIVVTDSLTTVIPEPGTALLLGLGLVALSRARRD